MQSERCNPTGMAVILSTEHRLEWVMFVGHQVKGERCPDGADVGTV
jgi:hypothetical protein